MVSKEELRKLDKEELVDLVYDLSIKVDALTRMVEALQEEIKRLKTPKNSGNSSLPPAQDLFRYKNQSLREKSDKKSGGQAYSLASFGLRMGFLCDLPMCMTVGWAALLFIFY